MSSLQRNGLATLAIALAVALSGCGTPGAPLPPSLNLPDPVTDLSASRVGSQVSLTWTIPKKNTDKLLLKNRVVGRVCRREGTSACETGGGPLHLGPGAAGTFHETLPPALATGVPRVLTYYVELKNHMGRSAGFSNGAAVLAGVAPLRVEGLTAEVRKEGVVLHWKPDTVSGAVRLERKLLTPPPAKPQAGLLKPAPEPLEENLLVDSGAQTGRAVDKGIRFGQTYEYRAQWVSRVEESGKTFELAGEFSLPVRVEARDVFPPVVPTGLAAVAAAGENNSEAALVLSWQPDTETDLLGYIVYRSEDGSQRQRISPTPPSVAPAFHDTHVRPGHTYRYAVSAIDQGGHESALSAEATETVPTN